MNKGVGIMRSINLLLVALVVSMATCSQAGGSNAAGTGRQPYETKQLVYFADGSLDEYTEYGWDKTYSHKDSEIRYSASGGVLERIEYAYNDDRGKVTTKITKDVQMRPKNRVVYQYTPQGNLWRESLVDNNNKVVSTYEYAYDNKGNRTSRIIKNRAGDKLAETIYTFDNQGKMISSQTRDFSESNVSSTEYSYDAQGNLVKQVVMDVNGKVSSTINAVWQNGREMRNEMLAADGSVRMRVTNEYGNNGELVKKTVENIQGSSKQIIQYEYTFQDARRPS
jgi:YD repeat-containing protein